MDNTPLAIIKSLNNEFYNIMRNVLTLDELNKIRTFVIPPKGIEESINDATSMAAYFHCRSLMFAQDIGTSSRTKVSQLLDRTKSSKVFGRRKSSQIFDHIKVKNIDGGIIPIAISGAKISFNMNEITKVFAKCQCIVLTNGEPFSIYIIDTAR